MESGTDKKSELKESWGRVAVEALKHPYKSGVTGLALGGANLVVGAALLDPIPVVLGAVLLGFGGTRMANHIRSHRHPVGPVPA